MPGVTLHAVGDTYITSGIFAVHYALNVVGFRTKWFKRDISQALLLSVPLHIKKPLQFQ